MMKGIEKLTFIMYGNIPHLIDEHLLYNIIQSTEDAEQDKRTL